MKLGTLTVDMAAKTDGLVNGLGSAMRGVQQLANEMKKVSASLMATGTLVAAFGAGMLKAGASVDDGIAHSLERLKAQFLAVAVQVSQMLMPAVRELGNMFKTLADYIAGLSSGQRQAISHFAVLAVQIGGVAAVVSKLSGVLSSLSSGFASMFKAIASVGTLNLIAFLAVLAAIVVGATLLHKAWRTNWMGIQDITSQVLNGIGSGLGDFGRQAGKVFDFLVDQVFTWIDSLLEVVDVVQKFTGTDFINVAGMKAGFAGMAKDIKTGEFFRAGLDFGKAVGKELVDTVIDEWKPAVNKLLAMLPKRGNAPGVNMEKATEYSGDERNAKAWKGPKGEMNRIGQLSTATDSTNDLKEKSNEFWAGLEDVQDDAVGNLRMRMREFTTALKTALRSSIDGITAGLKLGGQMILSKMGALGETISAGIQGFEQGGIWGALIAVIADLFTKFEGFQRIIDTGNGQLAKAMEDLNGAFGTLLDAFLQLMGGVGVIAEGVHAIIGPIIEHLSYFLKEIGQVLVPIGQLLKGIGQAIGPLLKLAESFGIFGKIMKVIGFILGKVFGVILATIAGTGDAYNWIVMALYSFFQAINQTGVFDGLLYKLSGATWDNRELKQMSIDMLTAGLDFNDATADAAQASAEAAGANQRLAESANAASEALSNVPSGYKVALARFEATAAVASDPGPSAIQKLRRTLDTAALRNTGNPMSPIRNL